MRQDFLMDFTGLFEQVGGVWEQIEAAIATSPELAGVGLALALGAGAAVALLLLAGFVRVAVSVRRVALASAVRRDKEIGARILVVAGSGGKQRAISAFMTEAIEGHLKDYMFGGLFRVIAYPGGLEGDDRAEKLMRRTEAEIIVWAETPRTIKTGVARILCRPINTFEQQRPPWTLAMPKERGAWTDALSRAMAYAVAKAYRPALGRPQDFRPERLQPVVESLLSILGQKPKADQRLLAELVDDASSGALQMAFAGDETWLDRSVDIARGTLSEINRAAAPDRWIAANITLGRALRLKAEKRFDPVMLREGMSYLTEALEALRSEPRFKLAESAAQAIGEAQKLLGTRRKFSISGGGL
jgi:hypothetical protein